MVGRVLVPICKINRSTSVTTALLDGIRTVAMKSQSTLNLVIFCHSTCQPASSLLLHAVRAQSAPNIKVNSTQILSLRLHSTNGEIKVPEPGSAETVVLLKASSSSPLSPSVHSQGIK